MHRPFDAAMWTRARCVVRVDDMNTTVINSDLPHLIPSVIAPAAGAVGVIDVFDALGGAGLSQPGNPNAVVSAGDGNADASVVGTGNGRDCEGRGVWGWWWSSSREWRTWLFVNG